METDIPPPLVPHAAESPLHAWVDEVTDGNTPLAGILRATGSRFLSRFSCILLRDPCPGWRVAARLFRGVVAIDSQGLAHSCEHLAVRDIDAFAQNADYRLATLSSTMWDNKAAVFTPAMPPIKTREAPPTLDFDGSACVRDIPSQVRQFEYFANKDLFGHPDIGAILDGDGSSHTPLLPDAREKLAGALRAGVLSTASDVLAALRSEMDPQTLAAMEAAGVNSVRAHNWLTGVNKKGMDPETGKRRRQAVMAYPLAWSLVSAPSGPVSDAVSRCEPLTAVLAKTTLLPEGLVRRMNGLTPEACRLSSPPDRTVLLAIAAKVARMPPGPAPRTAQGWKSFLATVKLADSLSESAGILGYDTDEAPGKQLLAASAGTWDAMDADTTEAAAEAVRDAIMDIHTNLCHPIAVSIGGDSTRWTRGDTVRLLMSGRDARAIAEASAWWHANQADVRARLSGAYPLQQTTKNNEKSWPALHAAGGPWTAANGLTVMALTDEAMLVAEHRAMSHCVNLYMPNCAYQGSHIVSIRTAQGQPIATAELSQSAVLPLVKSIAEPPNADLRSLPAGVVQFKGIKNQMPRDEAWAALWDYWSALMTGALKVDVEKLLDEEQRRIAARDSMAGKKTIECYDVQAPGALADAWRLYAPMLPKAAVKQGMSYLQKRVSRNNEGLPR